MLEKNQLVNAVIWPTAKEAALTLIDADGVSQSQINVTQPMRGQELAKLMPQGFGLLLEECVAYSLAGPVLVNSVGEFDTAVVTERAEVTFEERMARLERRERRREAREQEREREHAQALRDARSQQERPEEANGEELSESPEQQQEVTDDET